MRHFFTPYDVISNIIDAAKWFDDMDDESKFVILENIKQAKKQYAWLNNFLEKVFHAKDN